MRFRFGFILFVVLCMLSCNDTRRRVDWHDIGSYFVVPEQWQDDMGEFRSVMVMNSGDTVNTAARLESNAKRGQVLISEYVYEKVKDRITVEEIGEIPLKGKSKGVFVYSLVDINEEEKSDKEV